MRPLLVHGLDTLRHPCADRILPSGEVVRVVRVQALQAPTGATHPAPVSRLGQQLGSLLRVSFVH